VEGPLTPRRTQAERSEATRGALLEAARRLFTEHGFAATSRDEIAEASGVTRGALYHHFSSKEGLFRAVVEQLEEEMTNHVAEVAMAEADPAAQLRLGALAFLDACLDPSVRRIVLLEAPAVLGWDQWREIDERYGLALLTHVVEAAMEAGQLAPTAAGPLAHMLLGALNEAALMVATAKQPRKARKEVGAALEGLLERLLAPT
jgi:AcrR family transcriptional regulator